MGVDGARNMGETGRPATEFGVGFSHAHSGGSTGRWTACPAGTDTATTTARVGGSPAAASPATAAADASASQDGIRWSIPRTGSYAPENRPEGSKNRGAKCAESQSDNRNDKEQESGEDQYCQHHISEFEVGRARSYRERKGEHDSSREKRQHYQGQPLS